MPSGMLKSMPKSSRRIFAVAMKPLCSFPSPGCSAAPVNSTESVTGLVMLLMVRSPSASYSSLPTSRMALDVNVRVGCASAEKKSVDSRWASRLVSMLAMSMVAPNACRASRGGEVLQVWCAS